MCRSLQLEKEQLEERLNGLRADSLSKQADSAPAPAASPRGTAVLSALRAENEHLKHQLKVHISLTQLHDVPAQHKCTEN